MTALVLVWIVLFHLTVVYGGTAKYLQSNIQDAVVQQTRQFFNDLENRVQLLEERDDRNVKLMRKMQEEIDCLKTENVNLNVRLDSILSISAVDTKTKVKNNVSQEYAKNEDVLYLPVSSKRDLQTKSIDNGEQMQAREVAYIHDVIGIQTKKFKERQSRTEPDAKRYAFYALLANAIQNPKTDASIPFDDVRTNIGEAYNNKTGRFVCQQSGVYVFSWTITTYTGHSIYTFLVKNGQTIGYAVTGDNSVISDADGGSGVVELKAGDNVWVKVGGKSAGPDIYIYGSFSTFSGFRIY